MDEDHQYHQGKADETQAVQAIRAGGTDHIDVIIRGVIALISWDIHLDRWRRVARLKQRGVATVALRAVPHRVLCRKHVMLGGTFGRYVTSHTFDLPKVCVRARKAIVGRASVGEFVETEQPVAHRTVAAQTKLVAGSNTGQGWPLIPNRAKGMRIMTGMTIEELICSPSVGSAQ